MSTLGRPFVRIAWQHQSAVRRIRRMNGDDAEAMQRFVEALSARHRRWRFHGAVKGGPALARALVEGDAVWAAFDGDVLVGEARFVRDRTDPLQAELAIAVADAWHGRGVAAALLRTLMTEARHAGVRVLRADVMCDNARMQRFLQRHGFAPRLQWDGACDSDVFERTLAAPAPWHRFAAWAAASMCASRPPRAACPLPLPYSASIASNCSPKSAAC
jgi:RimJ/RimL family protein N-acetyltransferase